MVFSTVLGTMLAVGLVRFTRSTSLDAFVMAPAILPDLVLAIGLLSFFAWVGLPLGLGTVTIAHAAFGTAFVVAVVRARLVQLDGSLEEASQDLGAGWLTTFLRVTFPSIAPAVLAGALLGLHALARRVRDRVLHQRAEQSDPAHRDLRAGPLRASPPRSTRWRPCCCSSASSRWWPPPWPFRRTEETDD